MTSGFFFFVNNVYQYFIGNEANEDVSSVYNPGESLIKSKWIGFKYSSTSSDESTGIPSSTEKRPTLRKKLRKRAMKKKHIKVEDEVDEIIEILSSPEKSPFKEFRPTGKLSLRTRTKRRLMQKFGPEPMQSDESIFISSENDSGSLPSLDGNLSPDTSKHDKDNCQEDQRTTGEEHEFEKFVGEIHFDVYKSFTSINRGLTAEEIIEIILNPWKYGICCAVPQYVQKPSGFLLDSRDLADIKDIRADGNGVWRGQCKPTRNYTVNEKMYRITRSYSTHKETPNFRRLIIEVNEFPHIILQYYFIGDVTSVTVKPHGNSKSMHAPQYRRLAPSALKKMSEMATATNSSAKSVMKNFIAEEGGIENITPQNIPRNDQQVRNLKRKIQDENTDEIQEILHEYDMQSDNFIRKIDIRPDFIVVLSSNQQLTDLKRFCTRHPCSILGIDPTFHFGDFDVTVTTYRHQMLEDTTPGKDMIDRTPVFVGPVCVHKKKDTHTYYTFLSTLIAKEKELRSLKALGSDGEVAITNASLMAFESAVQLRCFNHVKKNIKNKLQDIGSSKQSKKIILSDIFGAVSDPTSKIIGLVDCLTHVEFDQKLESLSEKWDALVPGFWDWFCKKEGDTFKLHMIQTVRTEAGLRKHCFYNTNDNEGMNSTLQRVCGKDQPLPKFIKEIKEFITSQENQLSLAIVQQGHLRFKEEYKHFEVPISIWSTWGQEARKRHIAKVLNASVIEKSKKDQSNENAEQMETNTNISATSSEIRDVHESILEDIWDKAKNLLQKEFAVISIPEYPSARRVSSLSNPKKCYFVDFCEKTGKIQCECYVFQLHKICHHVVAVGEKMGVLDVYIKWRKDKKSSNSLSASVNAKLPKSAGRKPNEKKGRPKNKSITTSSEKLTIIDPFPVDTENNYIFRFLEKTKIMVCYGCGKKFRSSTADVPCTPGDIVLAKKEYRNYVNEFGQLKMSLKREFVHYHVNPRCVFKRDESFDGQKVIVTENIASQLKEEHKDLILEKLGLKL